jgi:aerobic-type carbon monoxide dehydrogenase small subunit (CoxS/CutS family)
MTQALELQINGQRHRVEADPSKSLLSVLRDDLDLTGSKYGCGEGQCGACTVLLDGRPVRSCITPVGNVGERPVVTIEGVARNGTLHPVQTAFLSETALQCGYCTAGFIMSAVGLLNRQPSPSDDEIKRALDGNICRCGTYPRVLAAVKHAVTISAEASRG